MYLIKILPSVHNDWLLKFKTPQIIDLAGFDGFQ